MRALYRQTGDLVNAMSRKLDRPSKGCYGGAMAPASSQLAPRSARGRRAPRVSGDERERAILQTAERLLGERPLRDISVDDLARGAGISRPTFYFYFASKEAVLLALMDGLVEEA